MLMKLSYVQRWNVFLRQNSDLNDQRTVIQEITMSFTNVKIYVKLIWF